MRATHWWIYIVLIGLVPLLVRFVMYVSVRSATLGFVVNEGDLVSFGLVLGVANLKELDHLADAEPSWRMRYWGYSMLCIFVFATLLVLANLAALSPQIMDLRNIKLLLIVACGIFGVLSHSIHVRPVPRSAGAAVGELKREGSV